MSQFRRPYHYFRLSRGMQVGFVDFDIAFGRRTKLALSRTAAETHTILISCCCHTLLRRLETVSSCCRAKSC